MRAASGELGSKTVADDRAARVGFRARYPEVRRSLSPILRDVWGYASIGATRTVDAHACRLRKKLSRGGRTYVTNVRGVGYRLTDPL
jgi:DNA-binding response OmpR family regulator